MTTTFHFGSAFEALTGHAPFPWQSRLFERLRSGDLPPAVDIPTGLGKTAVMAIWLLARAAGAPLPRRLVYVVDRRAVVDQATDFAVALRQQLRGEGLGAVRDGLRLAGRPLPISTLRGQHIDNREWLDDPAAPAIIVGTVDMVGSRLLFEGYGVSRRMRPYHAGLMGCDTLVMLDEAHLSRPFERLLRTIEFEQRPVAGNVAQSAPGKFAGSCATARVPPAFRVLPLSATLGSGSKAPFSLGEEDWNNEIVQARLDARKTLLVEDLCKDVTIDAVLAERSWNLAQQEAEAAGTPVRTLIYCDRRKVAESVKEDLLKRAKQAKTGAAVILFVGGRRTHEREAAANELRRHGLLADSAGPAQTLVFIVATSAGEVGVDLDADHMVCDLVAWERMVQRLGRVNRRGSGAARILVIDQGPPDRKLAGEDGVARHSAVRALLKDLPPAEDGRQAGPSALAVAAGPAEGHDRTGKASTPMPLYPALTRPLIDAWAMTSLPEHGGRPEPDPWLRGWVKEDPQTAVVWRRCLPVRVEPSRSALRSVPLRDRTVGAFFEAAPPHAAERLETETWRVVEWLRKRARTLTRMHAADQGDDVDVTTETGAGESALAAPDPAAPVHPDAPVAFVLDSGGRLEDVLRCKDVARELTVRELERRLAGRLIVVDARVCGLNEGLLDARDGNPVSTAEDNWGESDASDEAARDGGEASGRPAVRVRLLSDEQRSRLLEEQRTAGSTAERISAAWRESWAAPYRVSAEDTTVTWLVVEKWRDAAPDEDSRAMHPTLQSLEAHREQAAREAQRIATELGLCVEDGAMLVAAARRHDDGKRAPRWQRAFNAPSRGGPYAKTPGPLNRHVLDGYRHEFQSMLDAEQNGLDGLDRSDPRFELALHMIAAHHGHARPTIGIDGCDRLPPSAAAQRAFEVGRRFARLQRRWGPWGLAWWESLLRAADQRASRALDETVRRARGKPTAGFSRAGSHGTRLESFATDTGDAR